MKLQSVRDAWIARHADEWLSSHGIFHDAVAALKTLALAAQNCSDIQVIIK